MVVVEVWGMNALMLGVLSGEALLTSLVWIVVLGVVFWLLLWLIGYVGLPEPFQKVAKVVLAVAAVVILINILLGWAGHPFISW